MRSRKTARLATGGNSALIWRQKQLEKARRAEAKAAQEALEPRLTRSQAKKAAAELGDRVSSPVAEPKAGIAEVKPDSNAAPVAGTAGNMSARSRSSSGEPEERLDDGLHTEEELDRVQEGAQSGSQRKDRRRRSAAAVASSDGVTPVAPAGDVPAVAPAEQLEEVDSPSPEQQGTAVASGPAPAGGATAEAARATAPAARSLRPAANTFMATVMPEVQAITERLKSQRAQNLERLIGRAMHQLRTTSHVLQQQETSMVKDEEIARQLASRMESEERAAQKTLSCVTALRDKAKELHRRQTNRVGETTDALAKLSKLRRNLHEFCQEELQLSPEGARALLDDIKDLAVLESPLPEPREGDRSFRTSPEKRPKEQGSPSAKSGQGRYAAPEHNPAAFAAAVAGGCLGYGVPGGPSRGKQQHKRVQEPPVPPPPKRHAGGSSNAHAAVTPVRQPGGRPSRAPATTGAAGKSPAASVKVHGMSSGGKHAAGAQLSAAASGSAVLIPKAAPANLPSQAAAATPAAAAAAAAGQAGVLPDAVAAGIYPDMPNPTKPLDREGEHQVLLQMMAVQRQTYEASMRMFAQLNRRMEREARQKEEARRKEQEQREDDYSA